MEIKETVKNFVYGNPLSKGKINLRRKGYTQNYLHSLFTIVEVFLHPHY
ncbi:hypothetical protein HMPREF0379_0047 [[Eubacterium] yurii subsp. margaretiae ATCC 43715]|nr:hypothetical protein HMPREF0379_0047 [[Eubacterium] yurii subsp. margaretiae ATCC 43715]